MNILECVKLSFLTNVISNSFQIKSKIIKAGAAAERRVFYIFSLP